MTAFILHRLPLLVLPWALVACAVTTPSASFVHSQQETAMEERIYTLGVWRVKPDQEAEFIAAWKALGKIFSELPSPPGTGTLIQSVSDSQLFYSFGPWRRLEDVEAMRGDPRAQAGIQRLVDLCTEATPSAFRVVAEVPAASP